MEEKKLLFPLNIQLFAEENETEKVELTKEEYEEMKKAMDLVSQFNSEAEERRKAEEDRQNELDELKREKEEARAEKEKLLAKLQEGDDAKSIIDKHNEEKAKEERAKEREKAKQLAEQEKEQARLEREALMNEVKSYKLSNQITQLKLDKPHLKEALDKINLEAEGINLKDIERKLEFILEFKDTDEEIERYKASQNKGTNAFKGYKTEGSPDKSKDAQVEEDLKNYMKYGKIL